MPQVEEVKRMAGIVPIMIASIVFNTVYAQMSTVFVEQVTALHLPLLPTRVCCPTSDAPSRAACTRACLPAACAACSCSTNQHWYTHSRVYPCCVL
jgi:hypothetical protein